MIEQTNEVIDLARWALEYYVKKLEIPKPELTDLYLNEPSGVFVTLKEHGNLRGCIGVIEPTDTLENNIIKSAVDSALHDWRFQPVQPHEIDSLEIEVSVLSRPKETQLGDIIMGEHGLIIEGFDKRALYLPQVATEQSWTFDEWLSSLCEKATLSSLFWKTNDVKFFTFTAQVIHG